MRIIAGSQRGRKIVAPKNEARPTLDRSKETLFNIIQFEIKGKDVLDIFAGSGALGLEAYSRGAKSVTFIDNDFHSNEAIKRNCSVCGCDGNIIKADFAQALQRLSGEKFGLVFIDPPYETDFCVTAMQMLNQYHLLDSGAIVACEHKRDTVLPEKIYNLTVFKTRAVGIANFTFYKYGEIL
ncbi:MAG TPA: 16S rRNA (guanine(966)-N(2))-methyltransferase RsmD [Clostridia bacterium]|nr:16S rRNA (guanine(966)-N(2))-methyltransferase RsmD [Clostridia bacterium]